jgi:hypothetical protein
MAIILHPDAAAVEAKEGQTQHKQQREEQKQQQHHHWGQTLHYLDHTVVIAPGDTLQLAVQRQGPKTTVKLLGGTASHLATASAPFTSSTISDNTCSSTTSSSSAVASAVAPLQLQLAPRPPWLRPGAGIEDPAVWSVTKCRQLLGQMLQRAPGGKFPPIWNDLALMQVKIT